MKPHKLAYWLRMVKRHGAEETIKALLVIIDELTAMMDAERVKKE